MTASLTIGRRIQRERTLEVYRWLAKLRAKGNSIAEIAQGFGKSYGAINTLFCCARKAGVDTAWTRKTIPVTPDESFEKWREKWTSRILRCKSDGCWVWDGSVSTPCGKKKYAHIQYSSISAQYRKHGRNLKFGCAHRLSFYLFNGDIGPGMTVDHTCHNPLCVNPAHLRAITQELNSASHSPEWYAKQEARRGQPRKRAA